LRGALRDGSSEEALVSLTREMAEALRRASSQPDMFSADPGTETEERVYAPLVKLGFLTKEVRPWPANDEFDLIHYETTETGKWALRMYDKTRTQ
jgi:hypothetical protein